MITMGGDLINCCSRFSPRVLITTWTCSQSFKKQHRFFLGVTNPLLKVPEFHHPAAAVLLLFPDPDHHIRWRWWCPTPLSRSVPSNQPSGLVLPSKSSSHRDPIVAVKKHLEEADDHSCPCCTQEQNASPERNKLMSGSEMEGGSSVNRSSCWNCCHPYKTWCPKLMLKQD